MTRARRRSLATLTSRLNQATKLGKQLTSTRHLPEEEMTPRLASEIGEFESGFATTAVGY
jgi:hypothetical protein